MILLLKLKQMALKFFKIIQLKYFHDSLNVAVILTPDHELFSGKCAQFPLAFTDQN